MFLVGLKFRALRPNQQTFLDRHVFQLMRKEARQKRHTGGMHALPSALTERRGAHRIDVAKGEMIVVIRKVESTELPSLADQARMVNTDPERSSRRARIAIGDISTTGCSLVISSVGGFKKGDDVFLRMMADDLDIEIKCTIVYILPAARPRGARR